MQPKCGKFIKKLHFYRNPKLCVGENDYLYSQCFNIIFFPVSAEAPHSVPVGGLPWGAGVGTQGRVPPFALSGVLCQRPED